MALSAEVSLEGWLIHLMNFYLEQNWKTEWFHLVVVVFISV